jgi:valyl-tRNA synthetase
MLAPIMPYITEEIYQMYYKNCKSIHVDSWPSPILQDREAEKIGDEFVRVLAYVRQEKSRLNKSLKEEVKVLYCSPLLKTVVHDLRAVTKAKEVKFGSELKVDF